MDARWSWRWDWVDDAKMKHGGTYAVIGTFIGDQSDGPREPYVLHVGPHKADYEMAVAIADELNGKDIR